MIIVQNKAAGTVTAAALLALGAVLAGPDGTIASSYLPAKVGSVSQAGRFVKYASNPVLTHTQTYEATSTQEPTVLLGADGRALRLWYTANWGSSEVLGYGTSTDGGHTWGTHTGAILGGGAGGYSGSVQQNTVYIDPDTGLHYLYFGGDTNWRVSTSADGITGWSTPTIAIAVGGGVSQWANAAVVRIGSTWHALIEGLTSGTWLIYHATSSNGLTWTLDGAGAISALSYGGAYGGPWLMPQRVDGLWHLYYHAATSGNVPTRLYHATSPDLTTWTKSPSSYILTFLGTGFEIDQVADPCVVEYAGQTLLFYSGVDNASSAGSVGLAVFDGPFHLLARGLPLPGEAGGLATLDGTANVPLGELGNVPSGGGGSGDFALAQTVNITATGHTSITLTVPAGHADLRLSLFGQSNSTSGADIVKMTLNGDTGSNYYWVFNSQYGAANSDPHNGVGSAYMGVGYLDGSGQTTNSGSYLIAEILQYAGTALHKAVDSRSGLRNGTATDSQNTARGSGFWANTAAITSITLELASGSEFAVGAVARLYTLG